MRDVSFKPTTLRTARARAVLTATPATLETIRNGQVPKGDPLPIAKVAAVTAAKKTTEWIPYCHNIPIEAVTVDFDLQADRIVVDVSVTTVAKTGVEMEAMTAASAAALTLYDMLKMLDEDMEIVSVGLMEKRGGKSDFAKEGAWTAAVLTVSDRASHGEYEDVSGWVLEEGLRERGAATVLRSLVPDEEEAIRHVIRTWITEEIDIVLVTGGTGIGVRDGTPEAVSPLIDLPLPGIAETLRAYGQGRIHTALFSRAVAGVTRSSLVVTLPGSPNACRDALHALFPALLHAKALLAGGDHS